MKFRMYHSGAIFISLFVTTILISVCVPVYADSNNTLLIRAAKRGDVTAIQNLLDEGAIIDTRGSNGYSPLHIASIEGHLAAVEVLIAEGANVNNISSIGSTPLMSAAYRSYTAILQTLLAAGADTKLKSNKGNTALDLARKKGYANCIELIRIGDLAYAVNIDMPKTRGLTVQKFRIAATQALNGRGWIVLQENDNRIDAQLVKRRRIFKVAIQWNSNHITVRYLSYYGADGPDYLTNIRSDMKPLL
jgi:ankyrin repeat protein